MFHIPEARHAVLNCISGVRIQVRFFTVFSLFFTVFSRFSPPFLGQITNSADVLMRDPKTETEPPECEISINGRKIVILSRFSCCPSR